MTIALSKLNKKKERNSSFELIRIVAMSMIIIHHFLLLSIATGNSISPKTYLLINPWFYCGVNLFFLISGWFTIKFSIRKLVSFILLIFGYRVINVLMCYSVGLNVSLETIIRIILWPVSSSGYWFLQVYLFLIIFSPLINLGLKNIDLKSFRLIIILLSIGTVYCCNIGTNMSNTTGYTFLQGIYLYVLGSYLNRDKAFYGFIRKSWCLIGYIIFIASGSLICAFTPINVLIQYNSYSMIGGAVLLFIFLSKFKFKNKYINILGGASLGCYMLQDGMFGARYFYKFLHSIWLQNPSGIETYFIFLLVFLSFWCAAVIVNPILKALSEKISNLIPVHTQPVTSSQ